METDGYQLYTSAANLDGLKRAVQDSVSGFIMFAHVRRPSDSSNALPQPRPEYFNSRHYSRKERQEWREFMSGGFDLEPMLTSVLGAPMTTLHVQHPLVIPLTPAKLGRPGSLYRAHPCRENGISLWRPLREGLGAENGLFHVYPGSHMIQSEEELRASQIPPREVRINRDQVLVTRGGLWIQSGASGGGILMWMGFSTRMIGSGIDAYTLGVVVDAYNAMPLVQ